MTTSARLRAARWACLEAQARLDRLEAQRRGVASEAAACLLWAEICLLRPCRVERRSAHRLTPRRPFGHCACDC